MSRSGSLEISLIFLFRNLSQSSSSPVILVPTWYIIFSFLLFYMVELTTLLLLIIEKYFGDAKFSNLDYYKILTFAIGNEKMWLPKYSALSSTEEWSHQFSYLYWAIDRKI